MNDPYSSQYGKHAQSAARRYSYGLRLNLVLQILDDNHCKDVLDIGSASGDYVVDLRSEGLAATCCDINRRRLREARSKDATLQAVAANAEKLPFKAASFDAVMILNAFRYFSDPASVLNECCRVTNDTVSLILIEHNRRCHDSLLVKLDVVRYYSTADISALLRTTNFEAVKKQMLFVPPAVNSQHLLALTIRTAERFSSAFECIYHEFLVLAKKRESR